MPTDASILIVDDSRRLSSLVSSLMWNAGPTKILAARDAQDAMAQICTYRPKAVLTYWGEGQADGAQLVNWIRRGGEAPDPEIAVLVVCSDPREEFVVAGRDAGADAFVTLPIAPNVLMERMQAAIHRPRRFVRTMDYVGPCRRRRGREADYDGPKRRRSDARATGGNVYQDVIPELAQSVDALVETARRFDPSSTPQMQAMRAAAAATQKLAESYGDFPLSDTAAALSHYIDALGPSRAMERKVVELHLHAARCMTHTRSDFADGGRQMADRLQKLVARSSRDADAKQRAPGR